MKASRAIQPAPIWKIDGDYAVDKAGVVYLDNWFSAFSQPQHKMQRLFSDRFWFCLWFAWQNSGNYLWHVFPGWNINSANAQMIDHEVERIQKHRDGISRVLTSWKEDGLDIKNLGIFGGRVWKEGGGQWYLVALGMLWEVAKEVYWDEPRVIWLPTKGRVYGWPRWVVNNGDEHQTVFVGNEWILIHTEGHVLEHPIAIRDVPARVQQILS